ncbi:MAG: hypothetical protein WAV28_05250 [Sedimentisphaerales bacterium]|jgi:hypothetical protein
MNEFIEKNRRLFKIYCVAARIIGWGLLITAGIWAFSILSGHVLLRTASAILTEPIIILTRIVVGLSMLGVDQFIRFLSETEYQPSWILRYLEKILYLYAAIRIVCIVFLFFYVANLRGNSLNNYLWRYIFFTGFPDLAGPLIAVGLGQILRRVMPVIEESKTLV